MLTMVTEEGIERLEASAEHEDFDHDIWVRLLEPS